jgi:putative membrane protein
MHSPSRRFSCLSLPVLLSVLACHHTPTTTNAPSAQATVMAPTTAPRMSDGNIVAIIRAANNTDLSYARLVPARARSTDVRSFAQLMTTDHTILNARVDDIALKNGITPEDNAISLDFRDHSAARRDILRDLEGAKFDSTYAANEVQYHQELLAAIEAALVPNARNPELREFVMNLKPAVAAHLAHAEHLRATLATSK